jgi:hypothetical protein
MASESIDLKEVIDENSQISGESGYYPLWTKEIFTCGAQIIYGTFRSLDPALNWITGRKAMLKKEVIVEYKEQMLIKLDYLFLPEYYTQTLKFLKNTYGISILLC